MPQATDAQMQAYADQRSRVRAEQARALIIAMEADQQQITDIYDRAVNGAAWNDNRVDGPPHLLTQADMLVYNTILYVLLRCVAGTATSQDIADLATNWNAFLAQCVRPTGTTI